MTVTLLHITFLLLSWIRIGLADIYVYNTANKLVEDYDDQPANFGPSFPPDGLKGYLTLTNPKNACSRVAPPPNIPIPGFSWIALIPRTKSDDMCDFDLKVLNAQNANFSAVIIYNFEDLLVTMGPHGRDIQIPSTLITHSDGLSIISSYLFNKTTSNGTAAGFYVKVDDDQLFKFSGYVIPLVVTISISFLGVLGFMLIKCCLHRRRTRRHRLPRSALKQLKTKKFVKGDRWEVCAICLDDYEDGAKLRILPCDHAYHMKCIDPWLLNNRRQCPVCKRYVFPNQDHSDEEENNAPTVTERTPLIQATDENSPPLRPMNRQTGRRTIDPSMAGVSSTSLINDDLFDVDYAEALSTSSPRQIQANRRTTTDLAFEHSTSFSHSYPHTQLPRIVLRQSSSNENHMNNTTTYESVGESPPSFVTPGAANFFVGSLGGTTDNTTISARSVLEEATDDDSDDNDERMHSVLTDVGVNSGYISDRDTTNSDQTNL